MSMSCSGGLISRFVHFLDLSVSQIPVMFPPASVISGQWMVITKAVSNGNTFTIEKKGLYLALLDATTAPRKENLLLTCY